MQAQRHPHPHIDPRQPRNGSRPRTNPPVFAWKPVGRDNRFRLIVARDPDLQDCVINEPLREPLFLAETSLEPGTYFWRWTSENDTARSEIFTFTIDVTAVTLEIPGIDTWLERLGSTHPRIFIRTEEVETLRTTCREGGNPYWADLQSIAENLLSEEHSMQEPPFLPDRNVDYEAYFKPWLDIAMSSRRFMRGAEQLGLAYLASGDERYGRAACMRLASVSTWDPQGSSHISHNDEAHMSLVWYGPQAIDRVWNLFTGPERELVISQFSRRGQITYEFMHDKGSYGVTRFDSHAGREIVFLAQIAFALHEYIPEARQWLTWLRPVLCGIWPIWAGDDGGWAEGPLYGLIYVGIMSKFATTLKRGAGIDLYRRPFWEGHARWRQWCFPPYVEWMGFGDHTERWAATWNDNADLVDIICRETGTSTFGSYVDTFRTEADQCPDRSVSGPQAVDDQIFLAGGAAPSGPPARPDRMLTVFPAAGWCAVRTNLEDASRDIALIFRSSPFGAVSHSHANNNDFILHAGGKVLAMPSGYYAGYGSAHHSHWVWHTKSHNCVTLSDAGQQMRSHDSLGRLEHAYEDERLIYFRGNADASYAERAERCRRHVVFLKDHRCFMMADEFTARANIVSALQWNIHSWNHFVTNEQAQTFRVEREHAVLEGHFMYHRNAFFTLTEGWDPPPMQPERAAQWYPQYHLRFTPQELVSRRILGTVLCPGHAFLKPACVSTERQDRAEIARIGKDEIRVEEDENRPLIILTLNGNTYTVDDQGIKAGVRV